MLFGRVAHVPSEGQPYAIFSYAGLLPWNFFTTAITSASNSLVNTTNLITKVYFPRTARAYRLPSERLWWTFL